MALLGRRSALRRHRSVIASWVALSIAAGSLVAYAVTADGQKTHRTELNDAGVWVTNQSQGLLGRQNTSIDQLDANVPAALNGDIDVLQDGEAIISVDDVNGVVTPVDPSLGTAPQDDQVSIAGSAVMNGGSVAVVKKDTGALWASRVDPKTRVTTLADLDSEAKPLARAGKDAAVIATSTGTVIAASATDTKLSVLRHAGAKFSQLQKAELDAVPTDGIAQMTSVGEQPVVLDGAGRILTEAGSVDLSKRGALTLQASGPAAPDVIVATQDSLLAVDLKAFDVREVATEVSGAPARPVRLGDCVFAAWAAAPTGQVAVACDGKDLQGPNQFAVGAGAELTFRVNRGELLLNDIKNGTVWKVEGGIATDVSDWESLKTDLKDDKDPDEDQDSPQVRQPPQAKADELAAKAGRTTTLHVLDNDKVSGGGVLSIVGVKGLDDPGAQLQMSPDRQSVLLTLARKLQGKLAFSYTISDGTGGKDSTDEGDVTVAVVGDDCTAAPVPREGADKDAPTYPLAAGGYLEVSVLADWRDPACGDPVSLDDVPPSGVVDTTVTPEGLLKIRSPRKTGALAVGYSVSTGGEPATGSLSVKALDKDSIDTVAPRALADVASGQVGAAITVKPLDNDIPGADPTDPQAGLVLAGKVAPRGGLKVSTDLETGIVTARAQKPGIYSLSYAAGFGSAKRSKATDIRIVVEPATAKSNKPIAAPDTTAVRGMSPMMVDVLANDYDAKGRLLAVQHAAPVDPDGGLEVAVIDGRWLRISASTTELDPVTQPIEYTVSNGDASAKGTVTVTQKDPLQSEQNSPVPEPDNVTVRVADSVIVPVLDNDSTPSGDPVSLATDLTADVMGELTVSPPVGKAYVSGRNVRYVAPAGSKDLPPSVQVSYVVQNAVDPEASPQTGLLTVRLNQEPSKDNPNGAPTPRAIEGRVVEGDVTSLKIPLVGNDPDGDSVSVVAVGSAPKLGRILDLGANAISYQAFPGSTGTDEFTYVVTDRYGARSEGDVRVAVTPPGAPQAPVAVSDAITADLGADVQVDVLANDLHTPGTQLKILPLEGQPAGVELEGDSGPISVKASDNPRKKVTFAYRVTNGLDESVGEVVVTSVKGFNNPPVLADAFAEPKPGATSVDVDVLKKAYDIDGDADALVVDDVAGAGTAGQGINFAPDGTVSVPLLDVPQVVPFRVVDGKGAASAASIFVPAKPVDTPYLLPDASIDLKPGETKDVPIKDFVADPEGDDVALTLVDSIQAAPEDNLTVEEPPDAGTLRLTAGDRSGPGSVTFEVSDRAKLADPTAHKAVLSVPVQVGTMEPIISCPEDVLTVVEGGAGKLLDIASICHVWTADPAQARTLTYTADWNEGQQPQDVDVSTTDAGIQLVAGVNAVRDTRGALRIGAKGHESTGVLNVLVVAAGPPTLSSMSLDSEQGDTAVLDVERYARSPFGSAARWTVTEVKQLSGPALKAKPAIAGSEVSFATRDDNAAFGTYRFRVTVADDGGGASSKRPTASAIATLSVVTQPSAPTGLRWDGVKQNEQVTLSWTAPPANGGTISKYTVSYGGSSKDCPSSPCTIKGLSNAKTYSFTVTATNAFGESEPSNTATAVADRVPDAVGGLKLVKQRDGEVWLTWVPPAGAGSQYSKISQYFVSWPGGGVQSVGTATSFKPRGLTNGENVVFTVWGKNDAGVEPAGSRATAKGMGAGKPMAPSTPTASTENAAGNTNKAVRISWNDVGANGPGPVTYTVTRTGGGAAKTVCEWVTANSCSDDVSNDGTTFEYKVQARNAEATAPREDQPALHVSPVSAGVKVEAAATPDNASFDSAEPTGEDGKVAIQFDVSASHGKTNRVECDPACPGVSAVQPVGGASNLRATVDFGGGANGSERRARVRTCNDSSGAGAAGDTCSAWVESPSAIPYGPIGAVKVTAVGNGDRINWTINADPNGRPVRVRLRTNGFDQTWDTGRGSYSNSDSIQVGYDQSRTFTLTVTDSGSPARGQKTDTASATSGSAPVSISIGSTGDARGLSGCSSTNPKCKYVTVTSRNFSGTVTCKITGSNLGTGGFVTWTQGANEANHKSPNYFGGTSISITCSRGSQSASATSGWLP